MKLSEKAELLLAIVREATQHDAAGKMTRYFIPRVAALYNLWGMPLKDPYRVSGSGDARALKALAARGLIRPMLTADYAYAVTEDGIVEYERIAERKRAAGEIP